MIPAKALVAPLAVGAVVVGALVASGGDDPGTPLAAATASPATPTAVTDAEFCAGFDTLVTAQRAMVDAASPQAVADLRDASTTVRDLALGSTMPAAAKAGVGYIVDAFLALDDDATLDDLVAADAEASLADDSHADALSAYLDEACST